MIDKRQDMLASNKIGKLLFKLSMPAAVGMFVMTLYNVVDTIFIGHAVGFLGIAGLSIVFPVQMIIMGMGLMIGIGGASLISRSLGARDTEKAERTLGNSLCLIIIVGLLITSVGLSKSGFWVQFLGASDTILPYAKGYMDIVLLGAVFQMFAMASGSMIRAEGNPMVPMKSMILGAILNIALDAVFIIGLDMGVKGAAIATVISVIAGTIYLISYYISKKSSLKIRLINLILDRKITREILAVGISDFVRSTAMSIVTIILNRLLVFYGGDITVAGFGILHRIMMFVMMPVISVAQGLQPVLGFNYGAKQFGRALRAIKLSTIVATLISVLAFLVLFFFPNPIIRIFTDDQALVSEASHAAKIVFLVVYLIGFQIIGTVIFQALGKAVPAFLLSASRQILFLLPLLLILPRFFKLEGVFMAFPVADTLSFFLTLAFFIPQVRELRIKDALVKQKKLSDK
ncbi:MATE family efflux transporter [Thermodesulfobacteriota bacterium]